MKNLDEMLNKIIENPIELSNEVTFNKFLTEDSDFTGDVIVEADDPFGGDAGGGDAGGGDPFGGDAGGGDAGGDPFGGGDDAGGGDPFGGGDDAAAGGDGGEGGADGEGEDEEKKDPDENPALTDDSHEDDPDFLMGKPDNEDVTLMDTPAGKSIYDVENIMNIVKTVIQTLSEDQLVEMEKVKNCIELIFNGKKLNDEDLEFNNIKNAIFLIKKIAAKLDIKTKMYLNRKLKEPLIKKRDNIKQQIAAQKGDLQNARDALTSLDIK